MNPKDRHNKVDFYLPSHDFQQLGDAIELFRFVDELEEDVADGAADKGTQAQKFAVDAMKRCF